MGTAKQGDRKRRGFAAGTLLSGVPVTEFRRG